MGYTKGLHIAKNNFSESFFDHFPAKVPDQYLIRNILPQNERYNNYYGSILLVKSKKSLIQSLKHKDLIVNNPAFTFYDNRTLLLANNSQSNNRKSNNCLNTFPPIPDFSQFCNNAADINIDLNDLTIHIIESKSGEFIETGYLSKKLNLPDEWSHGYSKGIAFGEKSEVVIYWIIFW